MTLAIDYRVFCSDPELWRMLIKRTRGQENQVILFTDKEGTDTNELEISTAAPFVDGYLFASRGTARECAREAGWKVDVWVELINA